MTFNLIRDPWIPVRRRSGSVEWIRPAEIVSRLDDDPAVAFAWPRVDFDAASHEFLIGLLVTAAAPEDEDEWEDVWHSPPSVSRLDALFEPFASVFDLDGPGPRFMQDLDGLADQENVPAFTLLIDAPGEQTLRFNTDLFVKREFDLALSIEAAAMALFTLQLYAPSGGQGHRTSLRGGGPLTTLVVDGETLWGRLWPNVATRSWVAPGKPSEIFPWMAPTRTSEQDRLTTPQDVHPLQVYWAMPRRIRLEFADGSARCSVTRRTVGRFVRAIRTKNYGMKYAGFVHPLSPHYRMKAGGEKLAVKGPSSGIGWRHWLGLIVASSDGLREPARTVRNALVERNGALQSRRLVAFGYDMDNAKARGFHSAEMPIAGAAVEAIALEIERLVRSADIMSRRTVQAVKEALFENPKEAAGDLSHVGDAFWRTTEPHFYALVSRLDPSASSESYASDWAKTLRETALIVFDEAVPMSPSEMPARVIQARHYLGAAGNGYGKAGEQLFRELRLAVPKKAARTKKETNR